MVFLKKGKCSDTGRGSCTEQQFISSESVRWEGKELTKSKIYLREYRDKFLGGIIAEIESYFPSGSLSYFDIFNPKNIPNNYSEINFYGQESLSKICSKFNWHFQDVFEDWKYLLKNIVSREDFCERRLNVPQIF